MLPGDAIGLLGPNGAGKSTLLKAIAGSLPLVAGELHRAQGLRIGYFAQHQVEQLRAGRDRRCGTCGKLEPGEREQELRDFLGGFDFRGDMAIARSASFSGGEKARLALALIVRQRPNLLLLDEPTNHLDIEMREALAEALQDFEGALDRGRARPPSAARDDRPVDAGGRRQGGAVRRRPRRLQGVGEAIPGARHGTGAARRDAPAREPQGRSDAPRPRCASAWRGARKPFEKKLAAIEAELEPLAARRREAEAWLATAEAYEEANRERLQETLKRRGELASRIARLEEDWLWTQAADGEGGGCGGLGAHGRAGVCPPQGEAFSDTAPIPSQSAASPPAR